MCRKNLILLMKKKKRRVRELLDWKPWRLNHQKYNDGFLEYEFHFCFVSMNPVQNLVDVTAEGQ